jgi:hypothetical protein
MILLIPVSFLLLFLIFRSSSLDLRESAIRAYLVLFLIAAVVTEILSTFDGINFQTLAVTWFFFVSVFGVIAILSFRRNPLKLKEQFQSSKERIRENFTWLEGLILFAIALILVLTLITAVYSPPNNFDSMTYHMARVVHWIQNQSVHFYPTAITRQNYSMPLAEYMIMHLQILSQSDLFANLVQWSAFVLLILLVGKIADSLKVSRRGQYLSGLFVAALPVGILESSSTQNDILTAFFCVSFGYYLLGLMINRSWTDALLAGVSFGLALLTKGTAYIYCAGIGIPLVVFGLLINRKTHWFPLFQKLVLLVLLGLAINTPFYVRNLDIYGNPLSTETGKIQVDRLTMKGLYANLVRNISVNLAVPVPDLNEDMTNFLSNHLGSLAESPEITFESSTYEVKYLVNEDQAGNLLQTVLLVPLIGICFLWFRRNEYARIAWTSSMLLCLMLFSLLIKWQPWGTRLQLAIFALAAPLFGAMMDRLARSFFVNLFVVLSLVFYSLPYLFLNSTRPLVPLFSKSSSLRSNRVKRYFSDRPDLYHQYSEIIAPFYKDISIFHTDRERLYFASHMSFHDDYQEIAGILLGLDEDTIGLATGSNDWEYPLWVLTEQQFGSQDILFENVEVKNQTAQLYLSEEVQPLFVVATNHADLASLRGEGYRIMYDTPTVDLLVKIQ